MLVFAGLTTGLGEPVTRVFALVLAFAFELVFELIAVLQPTLRRATASKVRKPVIRRMFNSSLRESNPLESLGWVRRVDQQYASKQRAQY